MAWECSATRSFRVTKRPQRSLSDPLPGVPGCSGGPVPPVSLPEIYSVHYLLFYDLADDYMERRAPLRNAHLNLAWRAQEAGELVLAGALAEPADGAVFVFEGPNPEVAERFAEADPYVAHGVVASWRVRPWTTVVGDGATNPVCPDPE